MKRIAAFMLLLVFAIASPSPLQAQLMSPQENARQSQKAAKKQQKMLNKANKKQKKAAKKADKAARKENNKNNQQLKNHRS